MKHQASKLQAPEKHQIPTSNPSKSMPPVCLHPAWRIHVCEKTIKGFPKRRLKTQGIVYYEFTPKNCQQLRTAIPQLCFTLRHHASPRAVAWTAARFA
jgi:hypothetical protein